MQVATLNQAASVDAAADEIVKERMADAEATLLVNLASVQLRQGQFQKAQDTCSRVLGLLRTAQLQGSSRIQETATGLLALIEVCHGKAPIGGGVDPQPDSILAC